MCVCTKRWNVFSSTIINWHMDWRTSINNNMNIFFDVLRYGLYRIRIIYEVEGTREKKKVNKGGSEGGRKERRRETWDLFVMFSIARKKTLKDGLIDRRNSNLSGQRKGLDIYARSPVELIKIRQLILWILRRELRQFVKQISNQNVSREKESFSKRDDEKREKKNGIYHKRNIPRLIQIK